MATILKATPIDGAREYRLRTERLVEQAASAWDDLDSLTATVGEAFESLEPPAGAPTIEALNSWLSTVSGGLLVRPLSTWMEKKPLARLLAAIQEYDSWLDDFIRRLPGGVREQAASDLLLQTRRRSPIEGALESVLASGLLQLVAPWQISRRLLSTPGAEKADLRPQVEWWQNATGQNAQRALKALDAYNVWARDAILAFKPTEPGQTKRVSERTRRKWVATRDAQVRHWARRQRATQAMLDLERHLALIASDFTSETVSALDSLDSEHWDVISELDSAIEWIEKVQASGQRYPPPHTQARLVSAEDRTAAWESRVAEHLRAHLPAAVECVSLNRSVLRRKSPWRQLEPQKIALESLYQSCRPLALEGLREAQSSHTAIVRNIERAREVVAFGFESGSEGGGLEVAREALSNALGLLQYQRQTLTSVRPSAESSLVRAEAAVLLQIHTRFEESGAGLLAYETRRGAGRAARRSLDAALGVLRRSTRTLMRGLQTTAEWSLIKLGWVAPPATQVDPVAERARLGGILELHFGARELPLLYRRLFRIEPVEDPRFLVGRSAEMAGLSRALSRWNSGSPAAVLIVGDRGSGKTSLLNCAAADTLCRDKVVRAHFSERITTAQEMDDFLRRLLQAPPETDVEALLLEQRRVVVLEELERTYLRRIKGFDAFDRLMRLIDKTAGATFWILSINSTAFRYLNRVANLGRSFTHRINAMAVPQTEMTSAILQRHNLSGLRLMFAPLPQGDPRVSRLRKILAMEPDPQQAFFSSLYSQSRGVFRSALELWQDCIERVEGGLVSMRQPLDPNYQPLLSELNQDDAFTLQAFMQHGGLTEPELAEVSGITCQTSERRIARLLALELLEEEPSFAGFRVRPQAGRFARDVLHSRNLL